MPKLATKIQVISANFRWCCNRGASSYVGENYSGCPARSYSFYPFLLPRLPGPAPAKLQLLRFAAATCGWPTIREILRDQSLTERNAEPQ
jgi:hypothetical protein